jgi:hypothetical protein
MIFGCGVEMAGITVSRGIVKWFKGREMAMAMGSEMALARLGVGTCMIFSPVIATWGCDIDVSRSVAFGVILLLIAFMMLIVYFFMDKKLDEQTGEAEEKDDPFKISDLGQILTSSGFWLVALLCVLYYSAILPFQKYAVNMLQCNLVFKELDPNSFWAGDTVATLQYVIMLIIAGASFASNFMKKKSSEIAYVDKLKAVFLAQYGVCKASTGCLEEAEEVIEKAYILAKQFDEAPVYHLKGIRFVNAEYESLSCFDGLGNTAREAVENQVFQKEQLSEAEEFVKQVWEELKYGKNVL